MKIKESDWKIFKLIKEKAIEQFCTQALAEFTEVINNDKKHVHERYLLLYRLVQNRDKTMALLFDDQSRSKAPLQLVAIRGEGLADESLVEKLSEEMRNATDPQRHGW